MISIVMATYNGEKFIIEQLESIRLQSMLPDEVLIFDDCSTDGTVHLIEEYIKKYQLNRWHLIKNKKNKGYSKNFSDALKVTSGDIIFLSDQDDIWCHDKVKKMYDIISKNKKILLLASNVKPFYQGVNPQKVNFENYCSLKEVIQIRNLYKWIKPVRPGCSFCFRRELLLNYEDIWFESYPHDCLLWGQAVLHNGAYLYNRCTTKFRRHDNNASSRSMRKKSNRIIVINTEVNIINKIINSIESEQDSKRTVEKLKIQLNLYQKRIEALNEGNLIKILILLHEIRMYGRPRLWLTDLYYCMRSN